MDIEKLDKSKIENCILYLKENKGFVIHKQTPSPLYKVDDIVLDTISHITKNIFDTNYLENSIIVKGTEVSKLDIFGISTCFSFIWENYKKDNTHLVKELGNNMILELLQRLQILL